MKKYNYTQIFKDMITLRNYTPLELMTVQEHEHALVSLGVGVLVLLIVMAFIFAAFL